MNDHIGTSGHGTGQDATAASRTLASAAGVRVLFADHDEESIRPGRIVFEHAGASCVVAHTGDDALEKAVAFQPDIAVVDLYMATGELPCLVRPLAEHPALGALRIIVATGWGGPGPEAWARSSGAQLFLLKPCAPSELLALALALLANPPARGGVPGPAPAHGVPGAALTHPRSDRVGS